MDKAVKGKILEQLSKAGLDIEQTDEFDVRMNFALSCDHNQPPLLTYFENKKKEKPEVITADGGVEKADVDAAGTDLEPEAEAAEEQIAAEEARAEAQTEPQPEVEAPQADQPVSEPAESEPGDAEQDQAEAQPAAVLELEPVGAGEETILEGVGQP
jgi:hypothetical protein